MELNQNDAQHLMKAAKNSLQHGFIQMFIEREICLEREREGARERERGREIFWQRHAKVKGKPVKSVRKRAGCYFAYLPFKYFDVCT